MAAHAEVAEEDEEAVDIAVLKYWFQNGTQLVPLVLGAKWDPVSTPNCLGFMFPHLT